ncbi:MAG: hypothetical protein OXN44_13900 [Acidimicrobiaceae bacterium]|nr:hypothetical protein [Acidimicrobiaceae bacterium]
MQDDRFAQPLYTFAQAARFVGMHQATLATWTRPPRRHQASPRIGRSDAAVVTALAPKSGDLRRIPFIGLVEATVVEAFRRTGLSLQRIRRALTVLVAQGELEHALASEHLFTDGADILYDYAARNEELQIRLLTLTEVSTGQRVFHEVILDYLKRIEFTDGWATGLVLPVTERPLLRVVPDVAGGTPLFMEGGAPLSAVRSRFFAGEPVESIAADYEVPVDDITESLNAIWPTCEAA